MKSTPIMLVMTGAWCGLVLCPQLSVIGAEPSPALSGGEAVRPDDANPDRIQPYPGNPFYWQYKGKPVLLLGGSSNDSLFQGVGDLGKVASGFSHTLEKAVRAGEGVREELDLLRSVGGNYVRNTMSDRKGVKAFRQLADGEYDLNQWNDTYWQRFDDFLRWTEEREIIVGIEVWDPHDHVRAFWKPNPYNPDRNVNYTSAESGLRNDYPEDTKQNAQPFFFTVPALNNNPVVLSFQQKFVDKMLSYTLSRGNVLYLMDNEFTGSPEWSRYWAGYIRAKASAAGKTVCLTEMWRDHDLTASRHRNTLDHPDIYDFCDVSQNTSSESLGELHWTRMQWVRQYLSERKRPWPINTTKIYGSDESGTRWYGGGTSDAIAKFFMQIVGGQAATRFHRPAFGLGLGADAQACIKSGRMLTGAMNLFVCEPRNDLLSDRSQNEAYCTAEPGKQYAVYFPDSGTVKLDVSAAQGTLRVRWLDIARSAWQTPQSVASGGVLELRTPGRGHWAALVVPENETGDGTRNNQ